MPDPPYEDRAMDWDGPRYQVAAITAFGVVALKMLWPLAAKAWYKLGFAAGRLARKIAASQKAARTTKQSGQTLR